MAGLPLAQLAQALSRAPSALSQWETGKRRTGRSVELQDLEALDDAYDAHGALVDMALAMGTPLGLPARTTWAHNFQGPSGPVWAWLRPQPRTGRVTARLLWGAFQLDCAEACDDRGVFVTSPVSMPNPAVWMHLREPGWVDFGRGRVPERLGIPVLDALSGAELASGGHSPAGLVAPDVIARFTTDPDWGNEVLEFFGHRHDLVMQIFREIPGRENIVDLTDQHPLPPASAPPTFTGTQYRALRQARGLSQVEVADLVTSLMPTERVTDDQIGLLEQGGAPRPRFLRARLDRVYRADGHTCVEPVKVRGVRSPFVAEIPDFWIGPVWFTLTGTDGRVGDARIQWGPHRKRMRVRSGTTVTCRRPTPEPIPFTVYCPAGWTVDAGIGGRPDARDVNWGWLRPDDDHQAERPHVNDSLLGLFGRSAEDFSQLYKHNRSS